MNELVFYVLNSSSFNEREAFLVKLLNKAQQQARQVDVRFVQLQDAQRFDQKLWCEPPHSYIPHGVEQNIDAPIQLYGDQIIHPCKDVLINLHPDFYDGFKAYQRIIELLDQSDELIEKGRQRWRQYKSLGLEPVVHKIGF
ncbi:DNA polymerase III subunit chi [Thiomicrospira microaerophila]|uniref:DNA polymerase III subunit chi n=1 Tax=Thiomicrospira microaerophila TaxID=406020 RepID=UPI00200F7C4A|nr:DNA polymerase III subunit chi [Thiomicrospira microaerophila]UQB42731.1 DNA polymerase III subunit chi [Thiomicrospira microaerophila]